MLRRQLMTGSALVIVFATREAAAEPPVHRDNEGRAVLGYDIVAFWTEKKAVPGSPAYSFNWRGARWLFSSPQNLALFASDPLKYAPAYGGHCAVSMAEGKLTKIAKPSWSLYQGRLYFNYDDRVKQTFDFKNTSDFVRRADENWAAKYANL
jgi:YHS domain-containing protein